MIVFLFFNPFLDEFLIVILKNFARNIVVKKNKSKSVEIERILRFDLIKILQLLTNLKNIKIEIPRYSSLYIFQFFFFVFINNENKNPD